MWRDRFSTVPLLSRFFLRFFWEKFVTFRFFCFVSQVPSDIFIAVEFTVCVVPLWWEKSEKGTVQTLLFVFFSLLRYLKSSSSRLMVRCAGPSKINPLFCWLSTKLFSFSGFLVAFFSTVKVLQFLEANLCWVNSTHNLRDEKRTDFGVLVQVWKYSVFYWEVDVWELLVLEQRICNFFFTGLRGPLEVQESSTFLLLYWLRFSNSTLFKTFRLNIA